MENCTHLNIFAYKQLNGDIGIYDRRYIIERCIDCNIEIDLNGADLSVDPSGKTSV